jgi:sugar O-acyltransferase (sialic acid O-acetyltransferase NeuD family)
MVIIGTGGVAKDIVGGLARDFRHDEFLFFNDNPNKLSSNLFVGKYNVISTWDELTEYIKNVDRRFLCAIANPVQRYRITEKVKSIGGTPWHLHNALDNVSEFSTFMEGCIFQRDVVVSAEVQIGEGCFFNCGVIIGHDCTIGNYVSFGPGVRVLGNVEIGDFSYIGCNAIILPNVKIGKKVRVGIGKIVDRDLPDNTKFD